MKGCNRNGLREVKTDGRVPGLTLRDLCLVYFGGTWDYISLFHFTLLIWGDCNFSPTCNSKAANFMLKIPTALPQPMEGELQWYICQIFLAVAFVVIFIFLTPTPAVSSPSILIAFTISCSAWSFVEAYSCKSAGAHFKYSAPAKLWKYHQAASSDIRGWK